MDIPEFENWQRIKEHMEKTQTTDNYFYKRAVAILAGKADPLSKFDTTDHTDRTP